ncbi:hypothetical protein ACFZAR_35455 [Streptomyces sp. NPDC008222]|uniref:hypothetical protein n=1 Tax=Streptomyces sp. NPDC008222 TaxID=3364820 RepID=UPI0036E25506
MHALTAVDFTPELSAYGGTPCPAHKADDAHVPDANDNFGEGPFVTGLILTVSFGSWITAQWSANDVRLVQ